MKKQIILTMVLCMAVQGLASTFNREVPVRQYGKEAGLLLDLGKISLGTLNDVEVGFCTYCAPVGEGFLKQERGVGSCVGLCRYIRIQKGFSVYALYGTSADEIFMEQVEKILPYLHEELRRMFDVKYRTDVAAHMALFMDMQAEMKDQKLQVLYTI